MRRCAAMDHRVVGSLAEVPLEELGESSLGSALSTLLRISTERGEPAHQGGQGSGAAGGVGR